MNIYRSGSSIHPDSVVRRFRAWREKAANKPLLSCMGSFARILLQDMSAKGVNATPDINAANGEH